MVVSAGSPKVENLDAAIALAAGLPNVTDFKIGSHATDARLKSLETLGFGDLPNVRGPGLAALAGLPRLEGLSLTDTGVTDDGLKSLGGLKQIKFLALPRGATAAGLAHVAGLQQLETVTAPRTWPAADVEAVRKAFPKAKVGLSDR